MSAEYKPDARPAWLLATATALMCALAGGAVWCVLSLYLRRDLSVLALPIAVLIAWALRSHGLGRRPAGALIAAACTALACAYALYLLAAAKVASMLGLPLRDTVLSIGPDMAAAVAWAELDAVQLGTLLLALTLSAWLCWRSPRGKR